MGFRSTLTTEDTIVEWPAWFRDKYAETITFRAGGTGALHSVRAAKTSGTWGALPEDIQRAIDWGTYSQCFVLLYLHECGGVTRCEIHKDAIKWSEPESWRSVEDVEHNYCYGCSAVLESSEEERND